MRKKKPPRPEPSGARGSRTATAALPSEAEILAFVAQATGRVGKREIARAFGVSGANKIALKQLLKEAERKGVLSHRRKTIQAEGVLPPIALVEVTSVDDDGELLAVPVDWNEERLGARPTISLSASGAGGAAGLGDRVLAQIILRDDRYTGKALRTDRPPPLRIVGVYRANQGGGGRIVPTNRKDNSEYLVQRGDEGSAADGELVSAEVIRRAGRGGAQARIRSRFGEARDARNTSLIAIHSHGIPDQFHESVLTEAQSLRSFSGSGREDLRDVPLITIDPADARDHDDAIFAEEDTDPANPGGFKLVIAIADVAVYVRSQSALDKEARKRGNSVYFPDRVVPMLPERLSNDLCSLKEGLDRPALICRLTIDSKGVTVAKQFSRAVIRIAAGLTYEDAQAAIDGKGSAKAQAMLAPALRPLWKAYGALSQARDKRGPLEIDLPERKILLDAGGNFRGVSTPQRLDAHRLIEEFMIRANVAAAEALQARKTPLLFRVHDVPSSDKLKSLSDFLRSVNIPFSLGQVMRAKIFNRILSAAKGTAHERIVNEVVLRSQAQAIYHPRNGGHFGLGLANYAHFTSPIRRYADLIVHRALISAFKLGNDGLSEPDIAGLEETAGLISAAERRAMMAERETVDRLVAAYLSTAIGNEFEGRISGVVGAGLFVVLLDSGADGFLPIGSLGHERFELHQAQHALIGARTGTRFQLGDLIKVRLVEVAPLKGGLRYELAEGAASGPDIKRGRKPPRFKRHSR